MQISAFNRRMYVCVYLHTHMPNTCIYHPSHKIYVVHPKLTFIYLPSEQDMEGSSQVLKQDERCGKEGEGEEKYVKQRHYWKQVIQNNPRRCEPH